MSARAVAIITDDRIISMLAMRALRDAGIAAETFRSVDPELPEKLATFNARVVVVRGQLEDTDAMGLMEALREVPSLRNVRYVVLSNAIERAPQYLAAGATGFVPIPFVADQVVQSVNDVLRRFRTVLYTEDSRTQHMMVVPHLRDAGYDVLQAYDGEMALELLDAHPEIDLLLTDVDMPLKDGITLCGEVKRDPILGRLPVILLTAREDEHSIQASFDAGADDYLTKPVAIPELLARVDRLLQPTAERRAERILIADANPQITSMIAKGLAAHGLQCANVADGPTAQRALEEGKYDLAIIACELPQLDGVQLIRSLRATPRFRDFPVIMTSQGASLAEQVKVRSAGPQSFLVKPFQPERLLAEVERILAQVRHRRQLEAMRGYLSDAAVEAIERRSQAGDSAAARADTRYLTIVFIDIVGFTTLCESMSPHAVVRFLNQFFDEVVPILTEHGAQIDKFIGDCVMAVFRREKNGALRSVLASLAILEALPTISARTGIPVKVRIGINSGAVVMGDIGSTHHRRDFTVIGDNVNVAARLQTKAQPGEIIISASTLQDCGAELVAEGVGDIPVKGRREPVRAFRVVRGPSAGQLEDAPITEEIPKPARG